jgi:hypothetical protein
MPIDTRNSLINMNGRQVSINWTESAHTQLLKRPIDLYVEIELYFSCLVKKFIHFRDEPRGLFLPIRVADRLQVYFRPVTSTACSMEEAENLGRQPESELCNKAVLKMAPKSVFIDYQNGQWTGHFSL